MNQVNGLRYKRTLYVGLGGAGAKILKELKKKILEANGQKIPKQIKFLLIDTNATELSNYNNFDASEKICIAVREPYERFRADRDKHTHEFIPEVNTHSLLALERGAGQVRSNGHFAVIENQYSNKLMRIFHERADELMNIDINRAGLEKDPKIEIRIVFSLAGGTGSGTFLPISVILRSAIKHAELIGYAISPFHYERTVENSAKKTVMANGYAALAELDYMMHFGRTNINQENILFNFGPDINTQQIEQSNRPFDEVYYIDKRTNLPLSDSIEYTYNEIDRMFQNTADIIHIASTSIISGHTGTVDNVRQKINEGQFDVEDKFGWVSGVGMAELILNPKDKSSKEIREHAKRLLDARLGESTLSTSAVDNLAAIVVNSDWNESGGEGDENKPQKLYLKEEEINDIRLKIRNLGQTTISAGTNSANTPFPFEQYVQKKRNTSVAQITEERNNEFIRRLEQFIKDYIYGLYSDDAKRFNSRRKDITSLNSLLLILQVMEVKLGISVKQLEGEIEGHTKKSSEANNKFKDKYDQLSNQNANPAASNSDGGFWSNVVSAFRKKNHVVNPQPQPVGLQGMAQLFDLLADANCWELKRDRAIAAKNLLDFCRTSVHEKVELITNWVTLLGNANRVSLDKIKEVQEDGNTTKDANTVIVSMADICEEYSLNFDDLLEISKYVQEKTQVSNDNLFDHICELLSNKTGSLQDYLKRSIDELDSQKGDEKTRGRQEKTKCQKAIDKLIDLSAPTMQIDGHGYGARIKADQFYYIMTSDEEIKLSEEDKNKISKSTSTLGGIKRKTVAGLLQHLLEQNSLDIHVNCVNVSGWENKAVLYRVKGAIPPYFIDGVAEGPLGGQTMEGCYEELKKTRAAYTPFSHATLRQKLENGISVLRPHDSTSEEEAMEHWVNFMMLTALGQHGYIKFIPEDSETYANCSRQLGAKGSYSISSERLGSIQTGELADRTPILVLGNNRADAFHMFARYCKDILEEHKDYLDRMKHFEYCGIARQMVEMTGEKYMDIILSGWDHLFFDEEDQELLRREMDYIETRRKKFEDTLKGRSLRRTIVETHEKDSEESSSDNVQGKEEEKPE